MNREIKNRFTVAITHLTFTINKLWSKGEQKTSNNSCKQSTHTFQGRGEARNNKSNTTMHSFMFMKCFDILMETGIFAIKEKQACLNGIFQNIL